MTDREKAIMGLECCEKKVCIFKDTEKECPYWELCGEYESAFEDCTTALAKDALALLKAQPTVDGWISVKDRLPDEKENWITKDYQKVICCCDFGGDPQRIDVRTYGFGNGHFWHGPQIMDVVVTHWMPLPEPPKEDDDDDEAD